MKKRYTILVMIYADWIEHMNAYRIYDIDEPQQTIAYDGLTLEQTRDFAKRNGYAGIFITPTSTPFIRPHTPPNITENNNVKVSVFLINKDIWILK